MESESDLSDLGGTINAGREPCLGGLYPSLDITTYKRKGEYIIVIRFLDQTDVFAHVVFRYENDGRLVAAYPRP